MTDVTEEKKTVSSLHEQARRRDWQNAFVGVGPLLKSCRFRGSLRTIRDQNAGKRFFASSEGTPDAASIHRECIEKTFTSFSRESCETGSESAND